VLPELQKRGMAAIGMKSMGGYAPAIKQNVATAEELLRYAMSLPVTTTIAGMEKMDILEQNLAVARGFKPMPENQMNELRGRGRKYNDGRFEMYKVSLKYDNPEARLSHSFPIDMQSKEVKEMVNATENTGKPWPSPK
jgi:hypothetical protein